MPPSTEREIVSARVLDAPRQVVYRAFTDPSLLARWWGPASFTNTFHEFDPRSGGAWRVVMHGPDGTDYRNESQFVDVVAPERIVFDHLRPMHRFRMTMTFDDEAGRTRLTWRMLFESPEEADRVRGVITRANEENFDRLEAVLESAG